MDVDEFITAVAATGLPPIKCEECLGSGRITRSFVAGPVVFTDDCPCDYCSSRGVLPRCICCKADSARIANVNLCRECDIDCRGDDEPCEPDIGDKLLLVAGTL